MSGHASTYGSDARSVAKELGTTALRTALAATVAYAGVGRVVRAVRHAVEHALVDSCDPGPAAGPGPGSASSSKQHHTLSPAFESVPDTPPTLARAGSSGGYRLACSAVPFVGGAASVVTRALCYGLLAQWALRLRLGDLLRGAGVGGALAAFALRDVLGNLWSGLLLVLSEPFRVGDSVIVRAQMQNHEGVVSDITMRYTLLLQDDGVVVRVPNTTMLTAIVRTKPARSGSGGSFDV